MALESGIAPVSRYVALRKETLKVGCQDQEDLSRFASFPGRRWRRTLSLYEFLLQGTSRAPDSRVEFARARGSSGGDKNPKREAPIMLNADINYWPESAWNARSSIQIGNRHHCSGIIFNRYCFTTNLFTNLCRNCIFINNENIKGMSNHKF